MSIYLYQSKKVQRYIGKNIYGNPIGGIEDIDPLLLWHADVFFVQRQPHLVLANPLTKFTFFIFRYSKKTHPDFLQSFQDQLAYTLKAADIDPTKYLDKCSSVIPHDKTDRSAAAHLSRTKADYGYMISSRSHNIYPPEDEAYYNKLITDNIVSYHKKDYDFPSHRFYHELILRRWD